jgi:hypothetical protein
MAHHLANHLANHRAQRDRIVSHRLHNNQAPNRCVPLPTWSSAAAPGSGT